MSIITCPNSQSLAELKTFNSQRYINILLRPNEQRQVSNQNTQISVDTILIETLLECTKFQCYVWEKFTKCHKENTIDTISRNHTNYPVGSVRAWRHARELLASFVLLLQNELVQWHFPAHTQWCKNSNWKRFLSMCVVNNHKMHFIVEVSVYHEISQRFSLIMQISYASENKTRLSILEKQTQSIQFLSRLKLISFLFRFHIRIICLSVMMNDECQ